MPQEKIIVLANSKKLGGRCIAGVSTVDGRWVRPISGREDGALAFHEGMIDLHHPAPLDLVTFDYREELDDPAQPENVLLEDESFERVGAVENVDAYELLEPHLVHGPELLGDRSDRISVDRAQGGLESSLCLVEPESISFACRPPFRPGEARKARAIFSIGAQMYDFGITDAVVAPQVRSQSYGTYSASELGFEPEAKTVLTISLTTPLGEMHYKLAAAVLFLP